MRGYFCPLVVHLVHKQSESSGRPHRPLVGRSPFLPSSPSSSFSIRFIDIAFAFLVYLGTGLFVQLLCEAARLFGGVAFEPLHHPYSPQVKGWVTLFAITCTGLALSCYFWFLGREKVEYVFWRLTKPSKRLFQRGLKDFSFGVLAWLITFPCVTLIALAVSLSLHYFIHVPGIEQVAVQYLRSVQGYPLLFKMMVVAMVALVPVMEEVLFRGLLQNWLLRRLKRLWAILLTALVFALCHFSLSQGWSNIELLIPLFFLRAVLGFLYEKKQSLWAPVGLHMTFNGISIMVLSFTSPA